MAHYTNDNRETKGFTKKEVLLLEANDKVVYSNPIGTEQHTIVTLRGIPHVLFDTGTLAFPGKDSFFGWHEYCPVGKTLEQLRPVLPEKLDEQIRRIANEYKGYGPTPFADDLITFAIDINEFGADAHETTTRKLYKAFSEANEPMSSREFVVRVARVVLKMEDDLLN